jgi:hypothetical protein
VVASVLAQDYALLKHSGAFSVQLQPVNGEGGEPKPEGEPDAGGEPTTPAQKQRDVAETLQKLYLAVGVAITADEARALANKAGADLPIPGPFQIEDEPEPEPAIDPAIPPGDDDVADDDTEPSEADEPEEEQVP